MGIPITPKELPTLRDSTDPRQVDMFQRDVREVIRRLREDMESADSVTAADLAAAIADLEAQIVAVVSGVSSVSAGSSAISVSPTTGAVVVDVVEGNLSGIPQTGVTNLVSDLAGKAALSHTHAKSDVTGLVSDLASKQPLDATLTALAGLDATAGLVEQTGADTFTKRALGVAAGTSVPTRADADARFAAISHTHPESDITGLVADLASKVPTTTTISTTAPLTGGGDLSANRTFAIAADGIDNTLLRNSAGVSVIGRSANTVGDPADIAASSDGDVLRRTAGVLGFGSIPSASVTGLATIATSGSATDLVTGTVPAARMPALTGDVTTAAGTVATTIAANTVTDTKLRDSAAASVIGRSAATAGDPGDIASTADGEVLRRSGTTIGWGAIPQASVTGLVSDLALKAPLASPTFTGTVTADILTATGNVTIGNASTDAHSLNGTLNINGTPGTNTQILQIASGIPQWTSLASSGAALGGGTPGYLAIWSGTTTLTSAASLREQTFSMLEIGAGFDIQHWNTNPNTYARDWRWTPASALTGVIHIGDNNTTTANYDTTATAGKIEGMRITTAGTRTAGANDLTVIGLAVAASGGQIAKGMTVTVSGGATSNTALQTVDGDVHFNASSGTTRVQGAATFNSTVSIEGNATIGNATADSHTVNGKTLLAAADAGSAAIASLETVSGRTSAGAAAGSNNDIAIQYGGSGGGYRHWISTQHNASSSGNAMKFWLNTNASAGSSSAPGTGNELVLTLDNSGVTVSEALSVSGNATLGDASTNTHTVNGNVTFSNTPTAGPIKYGSLDARLFLGRQIFTASGTYTPSTGTKAVRVRMVGGGGGGGGAAGGASAATGGGGASGSYVERWLDPAATVTGGTVTIGAAGSAGSSTAGTTGGTGGDSSVVIQGTTFTAKGGVGGTASTNAATAFATPGATQSGSGANGSGTFASVTMDGEAGQSGSWGLVISGGFYAGAGGSSPLGTGGNARSGTGAGTAGRGYGAGGGGAGAQASGNSGGAGTAGVVIIEEYA